MRSSERARALLISALLALGAAAPSPAWAVDADAQTFFAQGRNLRAEGRCAEAIVAFRRALDLYPQGLGALRNIAECEEALGQFASARNNWWSLRRAVLQSNEPKYDGWERDAEQAYERLASRVARLTIVLRGAQLERAEVSIDGKPLDPRLVGVEIERDLGPHVIEVAYGGAAPLRRQVELAAGERESVTIDLPAAAQAGSHAVPVTPVVPAAPAPPRGGSGMRTAGFVALGVGGGGVVAALIAGAVRNSALDEIEAACPSLTGCSPALQDAESRGRTAATLVNVFGAVAIAGVGVGVPLLFLGRGSSADPAPVRVGVGPLAGGAAAQIGGRF